MMTFVLVLMAFFGGLGAGQTSIGKVVGGWVMAFIAAVVAAMPESVLDRLLGIF